MVNRVIKLEGRGLRGDSYADVARRSGLFGILPTDDDETVIGKINADASASADRAELAAEQATDLVLPENRFVAADLATARSDGEAATAVGTYFIAVGEAEGEAEVRLRTAGGSDLIYTEITKTGLASASLGKGAALVGFGDSFGSGTVADRINILSATARPAMAGIFSSSVDQRLALLDFINESAAGGKTIEWGPLDVSLDVTNPGFPTERGLVVPSGSHWVMHPDTRIRALPNSANNYEIINIWDKQDIVIEGNGARLIGERYDHTGSTGEYGMGLGIRGSTNIRVSDLIAEDCWGDGFYIGSSSLQNYCQDIHLARLTGRNNRRQGLSLISARNFMCVDSLFELTNGTAPEWGIDIEPNSPGEYLEEIVFERCLTRGNAGHGIGLFLNAMNGTENPVDVRIIDHRDEGSASAVYGGSDPNIPGNVQVIRPYSRNARNPAILFRNKRASGPKWEIVEPTCVDWNRAGLGSGALSNAIVIYATSGDGGTESLGNVDIVRPNVRPLSSGAADNAIYCADLRGGATDPLTSIRVIAPTDLSGRTCQVGGVNLFTDPNRTSVRTLPAASVTIGVADFGQNMEIGAVGGNVHYDINNNQAIGLEMVFEVMAVGAGEARVRFPSGVSLFPNTLGGNRYIVSTVKGSRLRIRKTAANEWMVVEKDGTWVTG